MIIPATLSTINESTVGRRSVSQELTPLSGTLTALLQLDYSEQETRGRRLTMQ